MVFMHLGSHYGHQRLPPSLELLMLRSNGREQPAKAARRLADTFPISAFAGRSSEGVFSRQGWMRPAGRLKAIYEDHRGCTKRL